MTDDRPNGRPRPFAPDELDGVAGIRPDELAAETRLARDLEGVSARGGVKPSPGFTDRVMGAVAVEPVPAPVVAAGSALRHGAAVGFLAAIRDSFRVAFGGGFPLAVRAQALALVLVVTGVVAGTGLATAGAIGLLDERGSPSPAPTVAAPPPSDEPSATPMPTNMPDATSESPSPSATPSSSPNPGETEATETDGPAGTDEAAESPEPGDGGGDGSSGAGSNPTPAPTRRPSATAPPTATPTAEPGESVTPELTDTPQQGDTPSPTATAHGD